MHSFSPLGPARPQIEEQEWRQHPDKGKKGDPYDVKVQCVQVVGNGSPETLLFVTFSFLKKRNVISVSNRFFAKAFIINAVKMEKSKFVVLCVCPLSI